MALLHERLYNSKNHSKIDFVAYIQSLILEILESYNLDLDTVKYSMDCDDVTVDMETAVSCGLIINELITNSIKYAFSDGKMGHIEVNLDRNNCKLILKVSVMV